MDICCFSRVHAHRATHEASLLVTVTRKGGNCVCWWRQRWGRLRDEAPPAIYGKCVSMSYCNFAHTIIHLPLLYELRQSGPDSHQLLKRGTRALLTQITNIHLRTIRVYIYCRNGRWVMWKVHRGTIGSRPILNISGRRWGRWTGSAKRMLTMHVSDDS